MKDGESKPIAGRRRIRLESVTGSLRAWHGSQNLKLIARDQRSTFIVQQW